MITSQDITKLHKKNFKKYATMKEHLEDFRKDISDKILTSQNLILDAIENMRLEMAESNMQINRSNERHGFADHTQCKLSA